MITDKTPQHYRLTLEDAIQHYKDGLLTVKGLVYSYLRIRLKPDPNWKVTLHHKTVCELLGIGKTAFYKAISALAKENFITWESPGGIVVRLVAAKDSTIAETESTIAETESTIAETESTIAETETPKPSSGKGFGKPSNSYQSSTNSLSTEQREKFKAFCKRQADRLPRPVVMLERWIAKNHTELWEQYKQAYPDQPINPDRDKSSATVTKLKGRVEEKLDQLISAGKLHFKQNLLHIGYVVLPNGDADLAENWIAT